MGKTFTKQSVSASKVQSMLNAAVQKANEIGLAISVCIVDESGLEKGFIRMDGAPLISVETSKKKAVLAAGFGMATGTPWHEFVQGDPILQKGVHDLPGFILLGGGVPIYLDGTLIGAVGVSGGHYKMDEQCANAAVESLSVNNG